MSLMARLSDGGFLGFFSVDKGHDGDHVRQVFRAVQQPPGSAIMSLARGTIATIREATCKPPVRSARALTKWP